MLIPDDIRIYVRSHVGDDLFRLRSIVQNIGFASMFCEENPDVGVIYSTPNHTQVYIADLKPYKPQTKRKPNA
jgi:hypothetical protein